MSAEIKAGIRWALRDAESEFPLGRETMAKRLLKLGEQPGADGLFSTAQICAAVFPTTETEKRRLAKEQADRIALDNEERRRNLIKIEDALVILRRFCFAVRQKILAASITDEEKNAIIAEIRRLADADVSKMPDEEKEQ